MKFFAVILLCAVAGYASADAPIEPIPILRHDFHQSETGEYSFEYESADGSVVSQKGVLHPGGEEGPVVVTSGHFSYVGPDGRSYTVHYTADENGYQPQAEHLPVAPVDPNH